MVIRWGVDDIWFLGYILSIPFQARRVKMKREVILKSDGNRFAWLPRLWLVSCEVWTFYCLIIIAIQIFMPVWFGSDENRTSNFVAVGHCTSNFVQAADAGADWVGPGSPDADLEAMQTVAEDRYRLPDRRIIHFERIEDIYSNGDKSSALFIKSCHHEPLGTECSEAEYDEILQIGLW